MYVSQSAAGVSATDEVAIPRKPHQRRVIVSLASNVVRNLK
jgi:hypothetical protein